MALALLALAGPARAADCAFADAQPGQAAPADLAQATICLLNERRAAAGLGPLAPSAPLAETAQGYADYMVSDAHWAHRDESGHNVVQRVMDTNPGLADRWVMIGENLGWGTSSLASPRAMVEGWMDSPTHRDNILYRSFDEVGVGVTAGAPVPDKHDALTYTTVFGTVARDAREDRTSPAAEASARPRACRRAKRARTRAARARAKRRCAAKLRAARQRRV